MPAEAQIADALSDIRSALISGECAEDAIMLAHEDYDLPVALLRNRAVKAFGDLDTYAERTRATRELTPEAARKLALGERREAIAKLGQVRPGSAEAEKLHTLVEEANALGGRFRVAEHRTRAPLSADAKLDRDLARLARKLFA